MVVSTAHAPLRRDALGPGRARLADLDSASTTARASATDEIDARGEITPAAVAAAVIPLKLGREVRARLLAGRADEAPV